MECRLSKVLPVNKAVIFCPNRRIELYLIHFVHLLMLYVVVFFSFSGGRFCCIMAAVPSTVYIVVIIKLSVISMLVSWDGDGGSLDIMSVLIS